jgi:hypothetical protein
MPCIPGVFVLIFASEARRKKRQILKKNSVFHAFFGSSENPCVAGSSPALTTNEFPGLTWFFSFNGFETGEATAPESASLSDHCGRVLPPISTD